MDATQYQADFGRSLASVFFPENVSPILIGIIMENRTESAKIIDAVKRGLFYDNVERLNKMSLDAANDLGLAYNIDVNDLHAMLGMEGEVTEISEVLLSDDAPEEKRRKIVDESGDLLWYLALLFKNYGITLEEVFDFNIAKLAKRYPDKFTVEAAVNRADA
ncbi:MazG nucleotide pyrophosphohydrolase domain-containing protein [Rhizobium arsenicireducens]